MCQPACSRPPPTPASASITVYGCVLSLGRCASEAWSPPPPLTPTTPTRLPRACLPCAAPDSGGETAFTNSQWLSEELAASLGAGNVSECAKVRRSGARVGAQGGKGAPV